ncbi:Gamma-aminobutyric acid receptor subunit beta [Armadillidium nasatum]|uniref:Gamma-aminobutyric acid receptor subunit beta n=1 Tax=Armadillidium nasatum TaxID=96803 RepID=A0A5N5SNJ5_9CRUS|nr:Gamma-aminobutyric acid receptor subunit beta [Armadillidium nasatum]
MEKYFFYISSCNFRNTSEITLIIHLARELFRPLMKKSDFTMDYYFRQHWRDPRLDFSQHKGLNRIQASTDYTNKIWVPDTFFPNEKRAYYHTATTPNEMLRIEPNGKDFTLDFYFRQHWGDPRLAFPNQHGLKQLTVGSEYLQKIWVPDTFFANEKKSYFHMATTSNEMLRISNKGQVLRSMRLTITASCPMNLQYFPMDRQLCIIEIESFGYSMDHIRLSWYAGDDSVVIESDVSLPQFRVLGYSRKTIIASTSTGNYSRLLCEIMFVRSMGYYLIQIYIPSSLIVVISWVSFWLNRAEYAAVGYLGKRIQMRKNRIMNLQKLAEQRKAANAASEHPDHNIKQTLRGKLRVRHPLFQEVRYKVHDPKAHSKGGTLENTINGRADEEAPPLPPPAFPPPKDLNKTSTSTPESYSPSASFASILCIGLFTFIFRTILQKI